MALREDIAETPVTADPVPCLDDHDVDPLPLQTRADRLAETPVAAHDPVTIVRRIDRLAQRAAVPPGQPALQQVQAGRLEGHRQMRGKGVERIDNVVRTERGHVRLDVVRVGAADHPDVRLPSHPLEQFGKVHVAPVSVADRVTEEEIQLLKKARFQISDIEHKQPESALQPHRISGKISNQSAFTATDADVGDTLTLSAPTLPGWLSFNPATGVYTDMIEAGILDPTKVTRYALQNAASVSGLLLTTEAMVADAPQDDAGGMPAMPDMGGMGGMGGMM